MVAVFTGNGLGLFNTTQGGGNGRVGQGQDGQFVNLATGNLVLQSQDEQLLFRGLPVAQLRTYNSLGSWAQMGSDGWLTGFERRVELVSGVFNQAGSVMRRWLGDGSYQDFAYSSANTYVSKAGEGADDTLVYSGVWTYTEGSTRQQEEYESAALQGRLRAIRRFTSDGTAPTTWDVSYDAQGRVSAITANDGTGNGDALLFGYDAVTGYLTSVATREGGVVRGQVVYGYDSAGRLSTVTTDLTPDNTADNSFSGNVDGRLFRTTYTYVDATSLKIATITQSDGSVVSYTYQADGKVKTVTVGDTNTSAADGVGETLSFTYNGSSTTVTDDLGRAWTYAFDAQGQLTQLTSPAVNGLSDVTSYQYDPSGNGTLWQVKTERGGVLQARQDYQYDGNGNLLWQWDALGNAIGRTYSATNQLLTETRYTGVDPDGPGAQLPTGGLTTRYVYDARDRVRFVIDASGGVTEYGYATAGNGIGQAATLRQYTAAAYGGAFDEASLATWAGTQRATGTLTEYGYDAWGRLQQTTAYATVDANGAGVFDAGTDVVRFVYDAQGLLRRQESVLGAGRTLAGATPAGSTVTDYAYDGMGRLLGVVQRNASTAAWASDARQSLTNAQIASYLASNDAVTIATTYAYLDSGHQLAVTLDSGRTRTETRNAAGRLLSVSESGTVNGAGVTRTARNVYDAAGQLRASEDANGGRSYLFYDAQGRLEAVVDSTGAVTRTDYDGADRVVQVREYATRVDTSTWFDGTQVTKALFADIGVSATAADRVQTNQYDTAGRLVQQTDASGLVTTYAYDGAGRLLSATRHDPAAGSVDRVSRFFYDAADRLVATLDGEGYLTETTYDAAGRAVSVVRYANVSPSGYWASGTLAQLRPAAHGNDQLTRAYYDARGRQVGALDAEGYLTEWTYDNAGNTRAERRYLAKLTWTTGDTLASLHARAGSLWRESQMAYNALGQLLTQTNPEGTVTRFAYDEAGRLVRTTTAEATSEVREHYRRYDVFDQLIGEIDGEGALDAKTALLGGKDLNDPTLTQAQLDQAYTAYGVRHSYDALGQRIESIDAEGNKQWLFYDSAGRVRFVVRGMADGNGVRNAQGEVVETRYNAFGEVTDSIAYTGRVSFAVPGDRASVSSVVLAMGTVSALDSRRQFTYTAGGALASSTDAEGALTQYSYNAFGERIRAVQAAGTAAAVTLDYSYDRRGLLTVRTEAVGTALARSSSQSYDAFGRVISATDARGAVTSFGYDRLGRQLTRSLTVQGRAETWTTAYDAFDRITTVTDPLGKSTSYVYSTANRTVTVTTPEGVAVTTTHNRYGQTASVQQTLADGTLAQTLYAYDADGHLLSVTDPLGKTSSNEYDVRGLLAASVDASGRRVELRYDAAGRVLQRIEDPGSGKLNLTTTYSYDGQGRQLTVTDASNRVTQMSYDREGRLLTLTLDPGAGHLNQTTTYSYDAQGQQVTVTDATGRVEQYTYDVLGRRTKTQVNPAGANLTTTFAYDANDNLVRRTDATGAVTRFYYDEANRLAYRVDALGAITRTWYDAAGRVVATRGYATTTDASTLTDTTTLAQLAARATATAVDAGEYRVYDTDGRLRYTLSTHGNVREVVYDSAGRVVATRGFAAKFTPSQAVIDKLLAGTATAADIAVSRNDTLDEQTWQVYDAAGRARYSVDALGNTQETYYDAAGRVVGTRAYANPIAVDASLKTQLQAGTATLATIAGKLAAVADDARDLRSYQVFDAAGRARYTIDALGAVQEVVLDAAGRTVSTRNYVNAISVDATLLGKLKAGTATSPDIAAKLTVDDARDARSYLVYDLAGQLRQVIDSQGFVRAMAYDAAGRMTVSQDYGQAISAANLSALRSKLLAGTATTQEVSSVTPVSNSLDRMTTYVYDAAGRLCYTLTRDSASTVTVSELRYDAAGRKTASVAYGVSISASTTASVNAVATALSAAGGNAAANQRLTRYAYDANGQLRFAIDNTGAVTEQRYDGLGRVTESRSYGATVNVANATEANVAAAVAGIADVRVTQTAYNAAGDVVTVTDALNYTITYAYDGLGRRTSTTDALNKTWTYTYDAAGRQVSELSPAVNVATADAAGNVTITSRGIQTTIAYDALGNVVSRTENANAPDPNDRRTTQYVYDNRGHQIKTIFPDAGKINEATGSIDATGTAPSIEITYDARGRATVQKDVRGHYSYKVYDALDRVAYEVDQEGYVTGYSYDGFGGQTVLRRYATALNTGAIAGWSAGQSLTLTQIQTAGALTTSASDRTLTATYDTRGQKLSVVQSAVSYYKADGSLATGSPTTQFAYNSYGELVKESVLLEGVPGQAGAVWADTYRYYDALGRNDLTVDAEGYVTRTLYNARGEATETTEYARELTVALSTTTRPGLPAAGDAIVGYDRTTRWTYDAMGRKASEVAVRRYQNSDGSAGVRDVTTSFGYDAAGRVTGVTTDAGTVTTVYDALGRATSVREPTQTALTNTADSALQAATSTTLASAGLYQQVSPYTTLSYDAFGNAVQVRRYANGWVEGAGSAVADNARDQIQTTRYDRQGRAVWERDAENNLVTREYDAADNVTRVAYRLDGNDGRYAKVQVLSTYDKVGHQVTSQILRDQYDGSAWKPQATDGSEAVAYNAFGDITAKADTLANLADTGKSARFVYNAAGLLTSSNADGGAYRRYGYNLAGANVRVERDWTDTGSATPNATAVTRINVDKLGRTVAMVLPSFTSDALATTTVTQSVDRWGNVIQVIDARGYQSDYQYNGFNQVVQEKRPTVLVVDESGVRSWVRPTNSWFYDALGQLVGTQDANGNIRKNTYDSAGRLVEAKDALNNSTRYAYDVLGNQRFAQSAMGYVTLKEYDRLNRVKAIGDYMPNAANTARSKSLLQQYTLNQSGDRLQVKDALNFIAKYDYDSRSQLIRSQTATGVVMEYAYNSQGKKTLEKYARVTDDGTPGHFEWDPETNTRMWVDGEPGDGTRVDREGETVTLDQNTWDYDYFGRLTDHNNLSSRDYDYTYDARSGQETGESAAGGTGQATVSKTTKYYANGQIREVVESTGNTFRYEYDAAGNRTMEETLFTDGAGKLVHTITRTYYDSNNRIQRVTQDDLSSGTAKRVFHLSYEYDAVGNRRHVIALSGYGPGMQEANPPPLYSNGSLANRTIKHGVAVDFPLPAGSFTDADNETLIYSAQVQVGSVWQDISAIGLSIDPSTGRITGTPSGLGQTTFNARIVATDPLGQTGTGTFVFNVTNTPPTVTPVPDQTAGRNQAFNFSVAGYFNDVNNSALSFTASGLPSGLSINATTGAITGTVASNVALGNYTITVTANDGWGGTVSDSFVLTVANSAPVAPTIPNQTATAGTAWSYVVPAFTDPNGDALTYSASGLPSWMSFNAATRTLSGTAQPSGTWTITITATDAAGVSASKAFTVTTPNVAPVVSVAIPAQSAGRNVAWSYTVPANTFSDVNGDTLTYSVTGLPAGLSFNAATRVISGTATVLGSSTVTVTVVDGNGGTRSTTFVLSVVNNPPTYSGALVNRTANQGQSVSWTLPAGTFVDPNGDGLSYTLLVERPGYWEPYEIVPGEPDVRWVDPAWIAASNAGLSINATTGTITGNPTVLYAGGDPEPSYRVMITATDPSSAGTSGIFNLTVNRAPTGYASTLNVGLKNAFSTQVTSFSDPDGNGLTYTATGLPAGVSISSSGLITGTINTAGDYAIQVTATDAGGLSATATVTLHVANTPPTLATPIPNQSTPATVAWSYQVPAGTFTDANGDTLTYTAWQVVQVSEYDAELHRYFYYDEYVALPSWMTFNAATRTFSGTGPSPQTIRLLVIASDPSNAGASDEFTLTVGAAPNYAPVAPSLSTQSAGRNAAWSYTVPAFSDANGDPLTYSASGMPAGITFNATTRTFTGAVATQGSYTITVTANDGRGGVTSASFVLNIVNSAPTSPTITAQTTTAGVSWAYTVPAFTDPNGDALTYTVSGLPAWMSFNASTRQLSGMPSTVGTWTITVTATDAQGASASANFTVTTPNRAPTLASAIPGFTVGRGQSWSYQVPAGTFSDANGDALTYSASGLPAGIAFDAATRTFSGAPTTLGSYTITVSVADGRGGTASTTFSFTCGNSAPVYASALPNRLGQQNQSVSWSLPAGTFTDANGDALTYTALVEVPAHEERYWNAADNAWDFRPVPARWDSLSLTGLSVNASTGLLSGTVHSFTVDETFYSYRVKLIATDPSGAAAEGIFTVMVNLPPTAPTIANQSIRANQAWSYTVPAFGDANYDALTYTASGLPSGLSFNAATRVISGTPTAAGTYTVTITANDGNGGVASSSFTLTVRANNLPVAPAVNNATGAINSAFSYALPAFTDADGDALTYSATGLPPGLSFNASTRVISGTPTTAGTYTVTYTANDGMGGSASTSFVITVSSTPPANRAPVVSNPLLDQYADAGYAFSYTFASNTFTDPDGNPLTYTASKADGTALPLWLSFNASTRTFSGTPSGIADQSFDIRVTATDPSGASVSDIFNLYKYGTGGGGGGGGGVKPLMAEPVQNDSTAPGQAKDKTNNGSKGAKSADGVTAMLINEPVDPPEPPDPGGTYTVPYKTTEHWYTYDAENHLLVNNGQLVGNAIVLDTTDSESFRVVYDADGRETGRYTQRADGEYYTRTDYDLRGRKIYEYHPYKVGTTAKGISKSFTYDGGGRLTETRSYYAIGSTRAAPKDGEGFPMGPPLPIGGWLSGAVQYSYDSEGRLLTQTTKIRDPNYNWNSVYYTWDAGGSVAYQATDLTVLIDDSWVNYNGGYDVAGRVVSYRYSARNISWAQHTYSTTYQGGDAYQELVVRGTSTNTNYRPTTNTLSYDGWGRLLSQREHTEYGSLDDRMRVYAYNGDGSVQTRREGTMPNNVFTQTAATDGTRPNYLFVHAAGRQQAELREGATAYTRWGTSYDVGGIQDLNGAGYYEAGGGKVTVLDGENLSAVAARVYGSAQMWYVLAEANGLSDPNAPLAAGTQINAPNVTVNSNDANTFKPYNPGEAIGSTTPSLPYITPPPKHHCNVIAMVLMVVVAVVVTVFTAGAAAAAMGATLVNGSIMATGVAALAGGAALGAGMTGVAIAAAAVGGFMGSVASQVVGQAMGVVDHFSLRSAIGSGITAGLTAGIGSQFGSVGEALRETKSFGDAAKVAALAVANAGASYVGNKIAGVPNTTFSWRSIASSAVTNVISAGIGIGLDELEVPTGFVRDFAQNMAGGIVGNHVRRAFGLEGTDFGQIAVDAFGNALANAVVAKLQAVEEQHAAEKRLAKAHDALQRVRSATDARGVLRASLGSDVPDEVIDKMASLWEAGKLPEPKYVASNDLGSAPAGHKDGTIYVNQEILSARSEGFNGNGMTDAGLITALTEEYGHYLDYLARNVYSDIGGDSDLDEGALFAAGMLNLDTSTGPVSRDYVISGQHYTFVGDMDNQRWLGQTVFNDMRVAQDLKTPDGMEFFDAMGHYYTVGIQALRAGYEPQRAGRIAFFAQLPDMVAAIDAQAAFDRWMSRGRVVDPERPSWAERQRQMEIDNAAREDLLRVQRDNHSLLTPGMDRRKEMQATEALVLEGLRSGDDMLAGFAIHKFGDMYAHAGYAPPFGHGADAVNPRVLWERGAAWKTFFFGVFGLGSAMSDAGHQTDWFSLHGQRNLDYASRLGQLFAQGLSPTARAPGVGQVSSMINVAKTFQDSSNDNEAFNQSYASQAMNSFGPNRNYFMGPSAIPEPGNSRESIAASLNRVPANIRQLYFGTLNTNSAANQVSATLAKYYQRLNYYRTH